MADSLGVCILSFLPFDFELFWQINYEGKCLKSIFIYCAHGIIDEIWAKKEGQEENPRIMILIFVESPDTFWVDDQDLVSAAVFGIFNLNGLIPDP